MTKYRIIKSGDFWQVQYKSFLFWHNVLVPTECWFISYMTKACYLYKRDAEEVMADCIRYGHNKK